jgi:hypothetical protein
LRPQRRVHRLRQLARASGNPDSHAMNRDPGGSS